MTQCTDHAIIHMHLHYPTDNHPPTSLPLPLSLMAKTSRDPFSPPPSSTPMKKNGGGQKKAAGVSATVAKASGSAGTPKKKKTSDKHKNNNHPELSIIKTVFFQTGHRNSWRERKKKLDRP